MTKKEPDGWLEDNRADWDRRVALHLPSPEYSLEPLRHGKSYLSPIEDAELPDLNGLKVLHLQCHFGRDSLALVVRGASVVGVDFSGEAIRVAKEITKDLGFDGRAEFHQCNLYDAPDIVPGAGEFDLVYTTWGTIGWLPDMSRWAKVVAHFLKPGGKLYFADGHTAALVLDDETPEPDGRPGWFISYFGDEPFIDENPQDYAGTREMTGGRNVAWMHPISEVLGALQDAGLVLDRLVEHDCLPWQMFSCLRRGDDGMYRWPDTRWWPLSWSLRMHKPGAD